MILLEENFQKEYERLQPATNPSLCSSKSPTAASLANTLFSMKHFSLMKNSSIISTINDNSINSSINNIDNGNIIKVSAIQHLAAIL